MGRYIAYRGQHGERQELETRHGSFSFSSVDVATAYALQPNDVNDLVIDPKVFSVALTINKPFIDQPSDCYLDLDDLMAILPGVSKEDIPVPLSDSCDYPTYQVWQLLDSQSFVDMLKKRGFDGAIYGGSGIGGGQPELRVFDLSAIAIIKVIALDKPC